MIAKVSTVIHEKTLNMKHEETERRPRVTCDFALPNCGHAAVFDDMYLRTNRTNHTKIMRHVDLLMLLWWLRSASNGGFVSSSRCFPHCCPHHRERSYCGSSVHVFVHSTASSKRDQLVVYGRFRPMHADPLALGTRLTITSVEASLQSKDPSKGQWIESKACDTPKGSAPGSQMYEINPEGRWYYPWSGAATIAMRLIEHIFEAHVFRHVGSELELVAVAGSTTFRLMSFRRGSAGGFKEEAEASPPRSSALKKRKAVTRAASPTVTTGNRASLAAGQERMIRPAPVSASALRFSIPNSRPAVAAPPFVSDTPATRLPSLHNRMVLSSSQSAHLVAFPDVQLPPRSHLLDRSRRSEAKSSTDSSAFFGDEATLSAVLQWLQELPANSVGSRWMLAWERIVQEACEAHITAAQDPSSTRSDLVPILSALDVSVPSASSAREFARPEPSTLDAIDNVVRLVLHLWLDVGSTHASSKAIDRFLRDGLRPNREALALAHSSWLGGITTRAQRFVREESSVDWSLLVAMSASRSNGAATTSSSDEFGFRSFAAQCREHYLSHRRSPSREVGWLHPRKRQRLASTPPGFSDATRVWTCRMEDASVEMDRMHQSRLSLLTVVQFWKHLSCLRLDFSPASAHPHDVAQLSVASMFNSLVNDGSFTKLTLDGQYRWFNCLPSGEPTVGTTLMGYVVGDYVGRATSAGTVHITTYLWPSEASSMPRAYAWHWTMDGAALASGSDSSSSVMSVVMESASMARTPHAMETMSMVEKLRCVGHWQHECELRLSYRC